MFGDFKVIKWLGLKPLEKPTIEVSLIKNVFGTKPIDYTDIQPMSCKKVGERKENLNDFYKKL